MNTKTKNFTSTVCLCILACTFIVIIAGLVSVRQYSNDLRLATEAEKSAIKSAEVAQNVAVINLEMLKESKRLMESRRKEYYLDYNGNIFRADNFLMELPIDLKSLLIEHRKKLFRAMTFHEIEVVIAEYTSNPSWVGFRSSKDRPLTLGEILDMFDIEPFPFYT